MGNQLVGIAPSQIHPVEYYLDDLPGVHFDSSLGSTRFFKVARANSEEGLIVVKVFTIQDPTLPLQTHKIHLEDIRSKLATVFNCIPFQHIVITDKAGLLLREYVKYSLYDRISTRPFLTTIEKKWITFQILYALHQCHKVGVCHGDIKLENICVTSWNWVLLVDFASFKPTFLPEDNPADYSYFFDTSRRRACYIAPERFVKGFTCDITQGNSMFGESACKPAELKPSMDVFSVGCSLLELWNEGHVPFDLSQLLSYCSGEYNVSKHLDTLPDANLRRILSNMLEREPSLRMSAETYLNQERGRLFPEYFYSFLQSYMLIFSTTPILPPDEKISRLKKDISNIINILKSPDQNNNEDGLVIMISLVTSCVRGLHHCTSKLQSLEIMYELASHTTADIILDRLIPYIMLLCHDQWSRVRASAVHTLTNCLKLVENVPRSDANVFPEYILPGLAPLATDSSLNVRCTLAQNITTLAETATKYLEDSVEECKKHRPNYDPEEELRILREMVQQTVSCLLTDSDSVVKQSLMDNGINKLCIFFGKQKANDIILSHMITFLNDKEDTELRSSFFDNIVGVATFVGYQSSLILTPLLLQGLTDRSEFVTAKCINAMSQLAELGLLRTHTLCDLVKETITLGLVHPSIWIRLATAGFVSAAANALGPLDTQCKLAPAIGEYLAYPLLQIEKPELLLQALVPPISRVVFDNITNYSATIPILQARQAARLAIKTGNVPQHVEIPHSLKNLFQRLTSEGMRDVVEDQLLKMANHLNKISSYKKTTDKKEYNNGNIMVSSSDVICNKIDLNLTNRKPRTKSGNLLITETTMNSEWQHMFGENTGDHPGLENTLLSSNDSPTSEIVNPTEPPNSMSTHDRSFIQFGFAECRLELRSLEYLRKTRYTRSLINRDRAERAAWRTPVPPLDWRCRGSSVAHLHEHKAAITRLLPLGLNAAGSSSSSTLGMFVSAGLDGCVRLWDCKRMEGKNIANRSKQVYQTSTGGIVGLATCEGGQTLCLVGRDGSLSTLRLEKATSVNSSFTLLNSAGGACDVVSIDGTVIVTVTTSGELLAYDLRQPGVAWRLPVDLKLGVPTALCVDLIRQSWLAVATNKGYHTAWDLRFRLPIAEIVHPSSGQGGRIRRISSHPVEHSWIISSIQGNNEISMWNLESGNRELVLWASSAPPLTYPNESISGSFGSAHTSHYILGLHPGRVDRVPFLLASGTDHRVRYWNLDACHESYIAVPAPGDVCAPLYKSRIIDGTTVVQEIWSDTRNTGGVSSVTSSSVDDNMSGRAGPELPTSGHRAPITDVTLCQAGQCFLIAGSTDGLITVWK